MLIIIDKPDRASWRFSLFWGESDKLGGGGSTLLKVSVCIKSGTLLGNIFFLGGGGLRPPKTGLQEALPALNTRVNRLKKNLP